jgi:hypothetical protein
MKIAYLGGAKAMLLAEESRGNGSIGGREPLEHILGRLALAFTVRDIMVPKQGLVCGSDAGDAVRLLDQYSDYNLIPIQRDGEPWAYLERGSDEPITLSPRHLVGDSTPVLDLVEMLQESSFFFIMGPNRIVGYVHYSDLNHPIVKLPYFVLLQDVEWQVARLAGPSITQNLLSKVLSPGRLKTVVKRFQDAQKSDANRGWEGLLYFSELICVGLHLGLVRIDDAQSRIINDVRNRICHNDCLLIEDRSSVRKLANSQHICLDLLSQISSPK